jgi:hypothetical protein
MLRPLPVLTSPLRIPSASRNLPVRWSHQRSRNVLVPVTTVTMKATGFGSQSETNRSLEIRNSMRGWFLTALRAARVPPRFPFAIQPMRPGWRKRVKYASSGMPQRCSNLRGDSSILRLLDLQRRPGHLVAPKRYVPKRPTKGPRYQLYLTFNPFGFYLQNT